MDNPCFGCQKRHAYCHGNCADYDAFSQKRKEQNERRRAEIAEGNDYRETKKRIKKLAERS